MYNILQKLKEDHYSRPKIRDFVLEKTIIVGFGNFESPGMLT